MYEKGNNDSVLCGSAMNSVFIGIVSTYKCEVCLHRGKVLQKRTMSSSSIGGSQGIMSKTELKLTSNTILFIKMEVHADEIPKKFKIVYLGELGAGLGVWEDV